MTARCHSPDVPALGDHPRSNPVSHRRRFSRFYRTTAALGCRLARARASLARVIGAGSSEIVVRQSCTTSHRASGITRAATAVTTKL